MIYEALCSDNTMAFIDFGWKQGRNAYYIQHVLSVSENISSQHSGFFPFPERSPSHIPKTMRKRLYFQRVTDKRNLHYLFQRLMPIKYFLNSSVSQRLQTSRKSHSPPDGDTVMPFSSLCDCVCKAKTLDFWKRLPEIFQVFHAHLQQIAPKQHKYRQLLCSVQKAFAGSQTMMKESRVGGGVTKTQTILAPCPGKQRQYTVLTY